MSFRERADQAIVPILELVPPIDLSGDIPEARIRIDAARRELIAAMPDIPGVATRDVHVPGLDGDPDVLVRIYEPEEGGHSGAALSYIHGGGMVIMSVDDTDLHCKQIVRDVGCLVTSVEYRLAPEHPYPSALHDCYAALQWLHGDAAELGVDPDRIAVGGESAGGGLSAGLALLARDRGGPRLCLQLLGIPELDDRLETESMQTLVGTPITTVPNGEISWDSYLGEGVRGTDRVSPYAAPARATDLAGLPPAVVTAYEFDGLRDEGVAYAQRLLSAGVSTELRVYPGAFHSCTWLSQTALSQRILGDLVDALRRRLHAPAPVPEGV